MKRMRNQFQSSLFQILMKASLGLLASLVPMSMCTCIHYVCTHVRDSSVKLKQWKWVILKEDVSACIHGIACHYISMITQLLVITIYMQLYDFRLATISYSRYGVANIACCLSSIHNWSYSYYNGYIYNNEYMASILLASHNWSNPNTFVFRVVGPLKLVPYIYWHCLSNSVLEFSSIDLECPNQHWK